MHFRLHKVGEALDSIFELEFVIVLFGSLLLFLLFFLLSFRPCIDLFHLLFLFTVANAIVASHHHLHEDVTL